MADENGGELEMTNDIEEECVNEEEEPVNYDDWNNVESIIFFSHQTFNGNPADHPELENLISTDEEEREKGEPKPPVEEEIEEEAGSFLFLVVSYVYDSIYYFEQTTSVLDNKLVRKKIGGCFMLLWAAFALTAMQVAVLTRLASFFSDHYYGPSTQQKSYVTSVKNGRAFQFVSNGTYLSGIDINCGDIIAGSDTCLSLSIRKSPFTVYSGAICTSINSSFILSSGWQNGDFPAFASSNSAGGGNACVTCSYYNQVMDRAR